MSNKIFSGLIILGSIIGIAVFFDGCHAEDDQQKNVLTSTASLKSEWIAPDSNSIPQSEEGALIRYGRELIVNTTEYLGPNGKIRHQSNGMNCQNCHLAAGTKPWGNNYGSVYSTYPKFRERRGAIETVSQRVNDCLQRSLNGQPLDTNSHEMKAMLAYMKWLGKDVEKGKKPLGTGIVQLKFLERPADQEKGKLIYISTCQRCHGPNGEGQLKPGQTTYLYPPLWGPNSYNTGAGLYRLTRFAGYVKENMPFGVDHEHEMLKDDEAWDVAAFVNSQPRPVKTFKEDWPNISLKPIDHPFGPYADSFSEKQHKYGPFGPIQKARKS
ncbi:MAG: c-type cytochrome [Bacteroidetes bacterium]|nr:c-type cytochrome [Bacteroidota bacterium]